MIKGVSCFSKSSIMDVWQGSEYASSSEYPRVLNSPGFWIYLWFWMCQSFGYTRVLNMPLVLNIPAFWMYQSYTGLRICLNNPWICLTMSGYVWVCLNLPEYEWICLNLPEWLLFYISPFVLQSFFYLNTWILIWTSTGD